MSQEELEKVTKTQYHPHFMIIPSLSCPASCRYCFGPNTGPAMDKGMVAQVIGFVESIAAETGQSKVRVTLHGGEPLAAGHDIIEALLIGLHDRFLTIGLNIGVQSNLWLLDEQYCNLFKKYDVSVSTSLDGLQEINDAQRGEGYFEKTVQGIKLAKSHGMNPACIATFTSESFSRWKEVFEFFMSHGIQFSIHPSVTAIGRSTGLELTAEQYSGLFCNMFDYYIQSRKKLKIDSYDQIVQGVACNEGRVCTFRDCFGMFLAIDPYGDIYSCQRFAGKKEYRLGNICDHPSMSDLINSPAGQRFLAREADIKEKCGECEHYGYCRGGCAYNAAAKEFDSVDPYCEAYKSMFSLIKSRLYEEMVSDENFKAISELGPSERGNPLMRVGPVTDLTDEHAHPFIMANTSRKIITAHELATAPDIQTAAGRLAEMGVFKSTESAKAALNAIRSNMQSRGHLNKLYLHVTWNCQLKCKHCYASAGSDANDTEMDISRIVTVAKEAKKCGFKEVVLTGGEPLLLRDRIKLLEMLSTVRWEIKPVNIVLRTNFAMPLSIDEHMMLAKAFDEIVVSVDGGQKEHDERRGEGSYDKTVKNLEIYTSNIGETIMNGNIRIRPARLSISATMKAGRVKEEQGFAVKALGRRLDIRHVKFRPLLPLGRALDDDELTAEALRSYLEPIDSIKNGFNPAHTCGIGQNLYVEPSGESFPCYSYHKPHSFLGNIIKDGLEAVVDSEAFKALQECSVDTNNGCKACEYRYLCGGACRAWGKESSQYDLNAAPVECNGLKDRAEKLYDAAQEFMQKSDRPE